MFYPHASHNSFFMFITEFCDQSFLGGGVRIGLPENHVRRAADVPTLFFGPTDECRVSVIEPEGMFFDDPRGFVSTRTGLCAYVFPSFCEHAPVHCLPTNS